VGRRRDRRPGRGQDSRLGRSVRRVSTGPPPGQQGPPPGQYGPRPGHQGPPPGQLPYGPPPGPYPGGPPPSGGGRSKGLIIGVVIAVLVVVGGGAAAAILLLGGDNEPSGDDPLATAQAFVDAWKDADCDALEGLLTDDFLNGANSDCDPDEIQGEPSDPEITEESGDKATAVINVEGTDLELTLVMEDGKWLIDGIGASESMEPPSASPGG
jgi:hypothetical protein